MQEKIVKSPKWAQPLAENVSWRDPARANPPVENVEAVFFTLTTPKLGEKKPPKGYTLWKCWQAKLYLELLCLW